MLQRTGIYAVAIALFGIASAAFAIGVSPADKAKVQTVMDKTPGAANVWTLREDGTLVHKASGRVCPASMRDVELWTLPIYGPSDFGGSHVGCEYGRGAGRLAEAKLSISFVKLVEGETLDSVFAQSETLVFATLQHVKPIGPAMKDALAGTSFGAPGPAFKSQAYEGEAEGRPVHVDLIVSIQRDWIVEVQASYFTDKSASLAPNAVAAWTVATGVGVQ